MSSRTLMFVSGSMMLAACATSQMGDDGVAAGDVPQLLVAQAKADGATAKVANDARVLNCQLEYEAFAPTFVTRPAASLETRFDQVVASGVSASDGGYTLRVSTNPKPPYNLSFIVQIISVARGGSISYAVLPAPHVGGAFLFEIGADIPAVTFADTGTQSFDNLRAYCSIHNP
jgi:hypothetical protein